MKVYFQARNLIPAISLVAAVYPTAVFAQAGGPAESMTAFGLVPALVVFGLIVWGVTAFMRRLNPQSIWASSERPMSITAISWILVFFSFLLIMGYVTNPTTSSFAKFGITLLFVATLLIPGIGMFFGQNWARLVFLYGFPVPIFLSALTLFVGKGFFPPSLVLDVLRFAAFYFAFLFLMTQPAAVSYFNAMEHRYVE